MRRFVLLAIALAVVSAPVAAGTLYWPGFLPGDTISSSQAKQVFDPVASVRLVKPILCGASPVGNVLCIDPGFKAVTLPDNNVKYDAETNKPVMMPTWEKYMRSKNFFPTLGVVYQSVVLVKKHCPRKAACDFQWCPDPAAQVGMVFDPLGTFVKSNINLCWPLMYETDCTSFQLIVTYATDLRISIAGEKPNRIHTDVFTWQVDAKTWADFECAVSLFASLPAGQCELAQIHGLGVVDKLGWFLNGTPAQNGRVAILGIKDLIAQGKVVEANIRFGQLEQYIESLCWSGCTDCTVQPTADSAGIINTNCAPVASVLLNDVWAIGKALGVLVD